MHIAEKEIINFINNKILVGKAEGELFYLFKSGSHLYGTNTPESDTDYIGIYIPKHINVLYGLFDESPGIKEKNKGKNTKDDVDLSIWSIQKFLRLLRRGDTNATEILFSFSNKESIIFDNGFEKIYELRKNLLAKKPLENAFYGYIKGHFRKYTEKAKNNKVLIDILRLLDSTNYISSSKLVQIADQIVVLNKDHIKIITSKHGDKHIRINDYKSFPLGMTINRFKNDIQSWSNSYGERVAKALQNRDRADFKAISHSFRTTDELFEILETKDLIFPLKKANYYLKIKNCKFEYEFLEKQLKNELLIEAKKLIDRSDLREEVDINILKNILNNFYKSKN